jgi:hypothetical protein
MPDNEPFIERRIVTGLIVSNDYAKRVTPVWLPDMLESPELNKVAGWCVDYYAQYGHVPDRDIEGIYMMHVRDGHVSKAEGELIERILARISDDYERGDQFNWGWLYDQTVLHFRARELAQHAEAVGDKLERGEVESAAELVSSFKPRSYLTSRGLEVGSEPGTEALLQAFAEVAGLSRFSPRRSAARPG